MIDIIHFFLENCKVASCFFLLLMLVRPLTDKYFSQSWHYLGFRMNLLLFFLPIKWMAASVAPVVAKFFPFATTDSVVYQAGTLSNLSVSVGVRQPYLETAAFDWAGLFLALWLGIGICLFLWHLYCVVRLHREVKGLSTITCPFIKKVFQKCKEAMGITAQVSLLECDTVYSPVLLDLCHPKILLPTQSVDETHLRCIFSHELTHLRRKDLWWKYLLTMAVILYWWNPLIYLLKAQFEQALEYSCDEEVVKLRSHRERKQYGKAILESIVEEQTNPVLGVSFRTPGQLLEMRLTKMMKFREMKTSTKVVAGALLSVLVLGVAAPTMVSAMQEEIQGVDAVAVDAVPADVLAQGVSAVELDDITDGVKVLGFDYVVDVDAMEEGIPVSELDFDTALDGAVYVVEDDMIGEDFAVCSDESVEFELMDMDDMVALDDLMDGSLEATEMTNVND